MYIPTRFVQNTRVYKAVKTGDLWQPLWQAPASLWRAPFNTTNVHLIGASALAITLPDFPVTSTNLLLQIPSSTLAGTMHHVQQISFAVRMSTLLTASPVPIWTWQYAASSFAQQMEPAAVLQFQPGTCCNYSFNMLHLQFDPGQSARPGHKSLLPMLQHTLGEAAISWTCCAPTWIALAMRLFESPWLHTTHVWSWLSWAVHSLIDLSLDLALHVILAFHLLLGAAFGLPLVPGVVLFVVMFFLLTIEAAMATLGVMIYVAGLDYRRSCMHVTWLTNMTMWIINFIYTYINPSPASSQSKPKPSQTKGHKIGLTQLTLVLLLAQFPAVFAAGSEQPKVNTLEYFLPGVTRWNGVPYTDFRRIWWIALCAALGSISQEGWTLLQTARNQDLGSPGNAGTPNQTIQSDNRNQRLFGSMLNYIEPTSWIYRYATTNFGNDGRGFFNWLYVEGHLGYTAEEQTKLDNEWRDATMASVGIKYTSDAVFRWAEYLDELGEKLNKSERDKRVKFLEGFPQSFDVMVVPERATGAIGRFTHPATYPAHHPQGGNAHPNAGEPDIRGIARGFHGEWSRMVTRGLIKAAPKGMAYQTDQSRDRRGKFRRSNSRNDRSYECTECSSSDDENAHLAHAQADMYNARAAEAANDALARARSVEHANMARDRVTAQTVCGVCGGIGHAGSVDGVGTCLTARLGHRIDRKHLSSITYPRGFEPPRFMHKPRPSRPASRPSAPGSSRDHRHARIASEREQEYQSFDENDDETAAYSRDNRRNFKPNKFKPKNRARIADDDHSQETTQNSTHDAESESDQDEHAQLAVAVENIVFK